MDSKTIKHVASLARIKLTSEEEENNKKELSSIIDYIEQLNKVNTDKVEPLYQTTGLVNSMREDGERGVEMGGGLNEKLIKQSPSHENGFVKVSSVLSK